MYAHFSWFQRYSLVVICFKLIKGGVVDLFGVVLIEFQSIFWWSALEMPRTSTDNYSTFSRWHNWLAHHFAYVHLHFSGRCFFIFLLFMNSCMSHVLLLSPGLFLLTGSGRELWETAPTLGICWLDSWMLNLFGQWVCFSWPCLSEVF